MHYLQNERRKDSVKQPKKPSLSNKKLIEERGYDPDGYMVYYEDQQYLHIIPKDGKLLDTIVLEKK